MRVLIAQDKSADVFRWE